MRKQLGFYVSPLAYILVGIVLFGIAVWAVIITLGVWFLRLLGVPI